MLQAVWTSMNGCYVGVVPLREGEGVPLRSGGETQARIPPGTTASWFFFSVDEWENGDREHVEQAIYRQARSDVLFPRMISASLQHEVSDDRQS